MSSQEMDVRWRVDAQGTEAEEERAVEAWRPVETDAGGWCGETCGTSFLQ